MPALNGGVGLLVTNDNQAGGVFKSTKLRVCTLSIKSK
jgi:hypothetical protein